MCLALPSAVLAQRGGGAGIDLTFASVGGGVPLSGDGTNNATLAFGNVSAFKPLGAGISRSSTATDYTVSTQFGVLVSKNGNGGSQNYTLRARLTGVQSLTWRIDGVAMSTTHTSIAYTQPYNSTLAHSLEFVVPVSRAPGAISAQFDVLAIAN